MNTNENREHKKLNMNGFFSLGKFITFVPSAVLSMVTKIPKFNLNKEMAEKILNEGLYHITSSEDMARKIVESQHLKPSSRMVSYDVTEWTCLFAGTPDIKSYMKNLTDGVKNPFVTPDMAVNAIKFIPNKDDMSNYKCRSVNDEVIMYQGSCILPHNKVEIVKLVPDLVRDDNGTPIKDEKGEYSIAFREATKEELIENGTKYIPKKDYMKFVTQKAKEANYKRLYSLEDRTKLEQLMLGAINTNIKNWDRFNNVIELAYLESYTTAKSIHKNYKDVLDEIKNKFVGIFKRKRIVAPIEEVINDKNLQRKNPYRDKKFAEKIAKFQKEDIVQKSFKEVLTEFNNSKVGAFVSQKYGKIEGAIQKKGIHGKNHTDRVSLMAMMIAYKENIFEGKNDIKYMDILYTASMYHDIGRVIDLGLHAGNSARKIKNMQLKYLNNREYSEDDKKFVMALVESHEGPKDKIEKLFKKYNINNLKDQEMLRKMSSILRDADALDRCRLDNNRAFNYKVNLNPDFLVTDSGKSMVMMAYQLENTLNSINDIHRIINYKVNPEMKDEISDYMNGSDLEKKVFLEAIHYDVKKENMAKAIKENGSKAQTIKGKEAEEEVLE